MAEDGGGDATSTEEEALNHTPAVEDPQDTKQEGQKEDEEDHIVQHAPSSSAVALLEDVQSDEPAPPVQQ
jgi:hypothetical protein